MARGISYHFGIHTVNDEVFENWPDIESARFDAEDLCEEAAKHGFEAEFIGGVDAKRQALSDRLKRAADELEAGDTLLLTFSGHGRRIKALRNVMANPCGIPGCRNPPNEVDGWDETLLMYDGLFSDNELYRSWCAFQPGVRIIIISDCCETGTLMQFDPEFVTVDKATFELEPPMKLTRPLPQTREVERHAIPPIVLLLSASQDDSWVMDKPVVNGQRQNGAFTSGILAAWRNPVANDTYPTFFERACVRARETFSLIRPAYTLIGSDPAGLAAFENESPLSIDGGNPRPVRKPAAARSHRTNPNDPAMSKIKVSVLRQDNAGGMAPIEAAPVVLFNDDMTIRSVGFTKDNGECKFLEVLPGSYLLLVTDAVSKDFRIVGVIVADGDVSVDVAFQEGTIRGKMIVTVTIGAATRRSGIEVNAYDLLTNIRVGHKYTDPQGEVEFELTGDFRVEALNSAKGGCVDVNPGVHMPAGNVVVPVDLHLPQNC